MIPPNELGRPLSRLDMCLFFKNVNTYLHYLPAVLIRNGLKFLVVSRYRGELSEDWPVDRIEAEGNK